MPVDAQNALGLLSASRTSEYLSFVTEVSEIVVGFGSFCRRRRLPAVRAGRSLLLAKAFRLSLAIFHKADP
jgi:hypothetical protein